MTEAQYNKVSKSLFCSLSHDTILCPSKYSLNNPSVCGGILFLCHWKSGHWLTVGVCFHVGGGLCVLIGVRPSESGKYCHTYINKVERALG